MDRLNAMKVFTVVAEERSLSAAGLEWKYLRLPQEPPRKAVGQRAGFREKSGPERSFH